MSFIVPNYVICIHNARGTSCQRFVPQYELPLIKSLWAGTAPGGQSPRISCDPITSQQAHLKTVRYTEVESLAAEKKRLHAFYEKHPITKAPIFDIVFPLNTFEDVVKKVYPGIFGEDEMTASMQVHLEDSEEEEKPEVEISDEIVDDLTQLKRVGTAKAKALAAAGFTSVSEIAQTDPAEIAAVKGITVKEAEEIVEHAVELSLGEEVDAFAEG